MTAIQRFAAGLRLNVHFHTLVLDGVFHETPAGLAFFALPPPGQREVARIAETVRTRVLRLLSRGAVEEDHGADTPHDVPEARADLAAAAVRGVQVLGRAPGAWIRRLGAGAASPISRGALHAHVDGFDVHGAVAIGAADREGRERLCRYLLRPAVAQDRLELRDDGTVRVQLRSAWSDGTTHLELDPLDFIGRLASLVPKPRTRCSVITACSGRTRGGARAS